MNYIMSSRKFKDNYIRQMESLSNEWQFVYSKELPENFDWNSVVVTVGWEKEWENELFTEKSKLKWVQSLSAGVDTLPLADFSKRGILLTNGSGIHAQSISDHVLGTMLMKTRGLYTAMTQQVHHNWESKSLLWQNLSEMTVLIVGTGQIGQEIARKSSIFGAQAIGLNTNGRPIDFFKETYAISELMDQTSKADFIINSLPLTADTDHLYDSRFFQKMKKTASFINIGRGLSVDEKSLSEALINREIAFASIDVTQKEPLPKDHFLWQTPNLMITPHISGMTPHFQKLFMDIFLTNLREFSQSSTLLRNEVDLKNGY